MHWQVGDSLGRTSLGYVPINRDVFRSGGLGVTPKESTVYYSTRIGRCLDFNPEPYLLPISGSEERSE